MKKDNPHLLYLYKDNHEMIKLILEYASRHRVKGFNLIDAIKEDNKYMQYLILFHVDNSLFQKEILYAQKTIPIDFMFYGADICLDLLKFIFSQQ